MNRVEALTALRSYPGDVLVSELYDHDGDFSMALQDLFPGTFEYPDFSHRKVSDVVRSAEKDCARERENEAQKLASDLEIRIRREIKDDLHDVSQHSPAVRAAYRSMGVSPHEDAEKGALQSIEARSNEYGNAEVAAKVAKSPPVVDRVAKSVNLRATLAQEVTILSADVSRMWAELDLRDYSKIRISPSRKEDAGLAIASNMEANADYKAVLIEKAPDIAAAIQALNDENNRRIAEKEARKAEYTISKNEVSGMVGLSRRGESTVVEFGGIPAIQAFAKEMPGVPTWVINELLARDGGYTHAEASGMNDYIIMHPIEDRKVIRGDLREAWAAAADSAVRHFEASELNMRQSVDRMRAAGESEFEDAECVPACRP